LQHQIKPIQVRFGYKDKTDYGAKGRSFGGEREWSKRVEIKFLLSKKGKCVFFLWQGFENLMVFLTFYFK